MEVVASSAPEAKLVRGEVVTQRTVNAPIAGSNPAEPAKHPKIDRGDKSSYNAYMKHYMRERRRRQAEKRETEK